MAEDSTSIRTFSSTRSVMDSGRTLTTVPKRPPVVTTSSCFFRFLIIRW